MATQLQDAVARSHAHGLSWKHDIERQHSHDGSGLAVSPHNVVLQQKGFDRLKEVFRLPPDNEDEGSVPLPRNILSAARALVSDDSLTWQDAILPRLVTRDDSRSLGTTGSEDKMVDLRTWTCDNGKLLFSFVLFFGGSIMGWVSGILILMSAINGEANAVAALFLILGLALSSTGEYFVKLIEGDAP